MWLTEEQEVEDAVSLYLLQSLQGSETLFGRLNQHHRLEFSPSPAFSFEFNLRAGETLNRRINNQERHRRHRTYDIGLSVNPTQRMSLGVNWEQRRETEKYRQFQVEELTQGTETVPNRGELPSTPISDLRQFEQATELSLRYELSSSVRWSGTGGYKTKQLTKNNSTKNQKPGRGPSFMKIVSRIVSSVRDALILTINSATARVRGVYPLRNTRSTKALATRSAQQQITDYESSRISCFGSITAYSPQNSGNPSTVWR